MLVINSPQTSGLLGRCREVLIKLMAVEVGERKSKGKQVSCIDTASQLISLALLVPKLASEVDV